MAKEKDNKSVLSFSPEEFKLETNYVVLNFLGLVPATSTSSSLNISRGSSSSDSKKSAHVKATNGSRRTPAEECSLGQVLPNLPEMTLTDKIKQHKASSEINTVGIHQGQAITGDKSYYEDEFDDDDTIYKSATKLQPIKHDSEDEVTIPVRMALTPDSLDSLDIVMPASKPRFSDVRPQGANPYQEESMFFQHGGSLPPDYFPDTSTGGKTPETEESLDGVDSSQLFTTRTDRFTPERPSSLNDLVPSVSPPKPPKAKSPSKHRSNALTRSSTMDSDRQDISRERSPKIKRGDSQRSPKPGFQSQISGSSHMSELSDLDSLMMSSVRSYSSKGSNYVDICHIDVDTMVKNRAMPEMMKELREEIEEEKEDLEQQYQSHAQRDEVSPSVNRSMSLSPESKVAQYLSAIGDSVQEKYGMELNRAFQTVVNQQTEDVDYNVVSEAAGDLVQNTSGWTKVTLLMLLGKKLTYGLLSQGKQGTVVHNMVSYTSRLVEDQVADFIISKGGWNSIRDLEEVESYSSDMSPGIHQLDEFDTSTPPLYSGDGPGFTGVVSATDTTSIKSTSENNQVVTNGATNNTISPDKNTGTQMTTSLHSEASFQSESSTLVDSGHENIVHGISRDTSSETLPSSLLQTPSDGSSSNKSPEDKNAYYFGDTRSSNNNDLIESKDSCQLLHNPENIHRETSEKSLGFTVNEDYTEYSSSEEGACSLRPRYNTSTSTDRHNLVEGTLDMDSAVENIQRELCLLRQFSNQYSDDNEHERQRRIFQSNVGLGLVIGTVALIGIMYIYKHIRK